MLEYFEHWADKKLTGIRADRLKNVYDRVTALPSGTSVRSTHDWVYWCGLEAFVIPVFVQYLPAYN